MSRSDKDHFLPYSFMVMEEGLDMVLYDSTGDELMRSLQSATVIQAALNALTSGRTWKETVLLKGNMGFCNKITIPSYSRLLGQNALITAGAALNDYLLQNTHIGAGGPDTDIVVEGITFDGNAYNQTGNYSVTGTPWFANVTNLVFRNNIVQNFYGIGGVLSGPATSYGVNVNCLVENNIFDGRNQIGVFDTLDPCNSDFLIFKNNKIYLGNGGVSPYNDRYSSFTDNEIIGNSVVVGNSAAYLNFGACFDSIIKDNKNHGGAFYGLFFGMGENPNTDCCQRMIVSSNILKDGDMTHQASYGIAIQSKCFEFTITKNRCSGFGGPGIGLALSSGVPNFNGLIQANICKNNGLCGIYFNGYVNDLDVIGNKCFDDQGTKTQTAGIDIDNIATGIMILNNSLFGNKTYAINANLTNVTNVLVLNNLGYNPQGFAISTPTFPASGTDVTNTFAFPVRIIILTTGTTTAYQITDSLGNVQAVSTSLQAGQEITLDPAAKIRFTYTVAPTWKWYGL